MKKLCLLFVFLCLTLPLLAQDQETKPSESEMASMTPPPGLDDEFIKWMVGEWQGTTESPMGKSTDLQKCWFGLDGQFLMMDFTSEWGGSNYRGLGAITLTQNGEVQGYWIDNMRTMSKGKGKLEGNVVTMEWESQMGKMTRVMEKVSDDKFTVAVKWPGPDGNMVEAHSEMTRKPVMTDKK
jgi:hypothetical protein